MKYLLFLSFLIACSLSAQERKIDPTWLRRSVAPLQMNAGKSSQSCEYTPIFGQGDADARTLRTVTRFGILQLRQGDKCPSQNGDREEAIYFVLEGDSVLRYTGQPFPMRTNDFTYVAPGLKHSFESASSKNATVLVMTFKVPPRISLAAAPPQPKIANMDQLKEDTVSGHPSSVLYKLLVGAHTASRDAIDQAYIVTSFFWMDFAPGGTNFPHHHEGAEEIYLVMDGQGEMAAGSGTDGIEGRYPAKAGDAYYFRPNCTVGFYNQNAPGAKAHILAVRARIPPPDEDD